MKRFRKKYVVAGMMEWHPIFKTGRTRLQVSFTGGHLCGGACTPASYETSDPVVQAVIEHSEAFRNGKIKIGTQRVIKEKSPVSADPPIEFEYEDIEEVYEYLHNVKEIPLSRLNTTDSCFVEAGKIGVVLKKKTS